MSRVVKVEVTAEDIANGRRGSACDCPVARACQRAGLESASFWPDQERNGRVFWGKHVPGVSRDNVVVPRVCDTFAERFDEGDTSVQPFSFELELP